jgi:holo-[acyl-carrier protein] synthase
MIRGIGLDAVNIQRLGGWNDNGKLLQRFFHPDELESAASKGSMRIPSLAARFAAKEAFGKALGTGLAGFSLREVAVVNDARGKPEMLLYGSARKAFERFGGGKVLVTLTHEEDYALACVIIEGAD